MKLRLLALLAFVWGAAQAEPLTVNDCVERSLAASAGAGEARLATYKAKLAEVEALYGPRLQAIGFVAPTFTVHGNGADREVERSYGLKDWGPYARLEATLMLPLYSFGRFETAEDAAKARLEVEEAQVEAAKAATALNTKTLYFKRCYALGLLPTLEQAERSLTKAREQAQKMFEAGDGSVTQVELARLDLAALELSKGLRQARSGAALAQSALLHVMGLQADETVEFADHKLPAVTQSLPTLEAALERAAQSRPEWRALDRGAVAAQALAKAMGQGWLPVFGAVGQLKAGYAPTRDDSDNPYHNDPYNEISGGVALGLMWNFAPQSDHAAKAQALAQGAEVAALRRFVETGIPMEVRLAFQHLESADADVRDAKAQVAAASRWMNSADRAFKLGSGDAKTLLEGLGAYVAAKKTSADAILAWHLAWAELQKAVGSEEL